MQTLKEILTMACFPFFLLGQVWMLPLLGVCYVWDKITNKPPANTIGPEDASFLGLGMFGLFTILGILTVVAFVGLIYIGPIAAGITTMVATILLIGAFSFDRIFFN